MQRYYNTRHPHLSNELKAWNAEVWYKIKIYYVESRVAGGEPRTIAEDNVIEQFLRFWYDGAGRAFNCALVDARGVASGWFSCSASGRRSLEGGTVLCRNLSVKKPTRRFPTLSNYEPSHVRRRLRHAALQIQRVIEIPRRVSFGLHAILVARLEMVGRNL